MSSVDDLYAVPIKKQKSSASVAASQPDTEAPEEYKDVEDRGAWGNQLEFILTCVGYAVGLGNVWRFPYLCFKNGGGAFLIPYILMLALCGMPVFFFEISFGQFASLGPLAIWTINPFWKGIGIGMVCVSVFVSLYYNILVAYICYFFFASMTDVLPWNDCDNWWNTERCLTTEQVANKTYLDYYLNSTNLTNSDLKTPSEEYYYNKVLELSPGVDELGSIVWQLALCLLVAWVIVYAVLLKGIASLGKVVYFTSTFPYIMMTIMVIRGLTLEGSSLGVEYYLKPDFSRLTDSVVWSDAASQIFYSLSTCSGGLIAMASYNKFNNNTYRDALLIPLINCVTSVFAGFAIFGVLGFMATLKGVSVEDVADSGPGLIFVVYPEGLSQMPIAPLWAILFFFMMLTLGFSSQFSIVECVFVALMDEFPKALRSTPTRPMIFRGVVITIYYLISLPMVCQGGFYLFNILDTYAGGLPRLFIGVLELIAVIWVYGLSRFCEDVCIMIGRRPNIYFRACWLFVSPALVIVIILFKVIQHEPLSLFNGEYEYPLWADTMGWMMVVTVVIWIPLWMIYYFFKQGGISVLKKINSPQSNWGPSDPKNRVDRYHPKMSEFQEELKQPSNIQDNISITKRGAGGRRFSASSSIASSLFTLNTKFSPSPNMALPNGGQSAPNGVPSALNGLQSAPNGVQSAPNGVAPQQIEVSVDL